MDGIVGAMKSEFRRTKLALNTGYLKSDRENNELYTPWYAVDPIIKYLPKDKIIWCPFDEEWSVFPRKLKEEGFNIVRSSLKEGQDFFTYEPEDWDLIISNPPFSMKDRVLKRLYEFDKPFAILLPLNSLQGMMRFDYFKQGVQMLTFDKRIGFHINKNFETCESWSSFATAYFCKDVLPNDLIIEKLIKYDKPIMTT